MNTETCEFCGKELRIGDWPFCPHGRSPRHFGSVHSRERAVVWEHPKLGVQYPMRSDERMPDNLARIGYQPRELTSLHEVRRFEREHGVISHAGNQNEHSTTPLETPPPTYEEKMSKLGCRLKDGCIVRADRPG